MSKVENIILQYKSVKCVFLYLNSCILQSKHTKNYMKKIVILASAFFLGLNLSNAQHCGNTPTTVYSWSLGETSDKGFTYLDPNGNAGGTISFYGGIHLNNVVDARECRVVKTLPTPLDDNNWKIEVTAKLESGNNPAHVLLGLADDSQNVLANALNCPDQNSNDHCGYYEDVKHNAIYVMFYNPSSSGMYYDDITSNGTAVSIYYKVDNGSGNYPQVAAINPIFIDNSLIGKNLTYKLERLTLTNARISVYDQSTLIGSRCFVIPSNLTGLKTLQAGAQTSGANNRTLTAVFNDYKIFNSCNPSTILSPNVSDVTVNEGESATLTANSSEIDITYLWFSSINSNVIVSTSKTLTIQNLKSDTTLYVSVKNSCGEISPKSVAKITVLHPQCNSTLAVNYTWTQGESTDKGFSYLDPNGNAGGTISFDGGIKLNNVVDARECRVVKTLPTPLDDNNWKIEVTAKLESGNNPAHVLIGLANDSQNVLANALNCPDQSSNNHCGYYEDVKHNALYVMFYNPYSSGMYYDDITTNGTAISIYYKVDNGSGNYPQVAAISPIFINKSLIGKNLTYRLERLSATNAKISVYDKSTLIGSSCFDIPSNLTGLKTLQAGAQTSGANNRTLTALFNDYKIYNTCKQMIVNCTPKIGDYIYNSKEIDTKVIIKDSLNNYGNGRDFTSGCNTGLADSNVVDVYYSFTATNQNMSLILTVANNSIQSSIELIDTNKLETITNYCFDNIGLNDLERFYNFNNLSLGQKCKFRLELGINKNNKLSRVSANDNVYSLELREGKVTSIEDELISAPKTIAKIYNLLGIEVDSNYQGFVIIKYTDGTTLKTIQ